MRRLALPLLLLSASLVSTFAFSNIGPVKSHRRLRRYRKHQTSLQAQETSRKIMTKQLQTVKQSPPKPRECTCSICGKAFASRNLLFTHLKTDERCAKSAGYDIVQEQLQSNRVALLIGYDSSNANVSSVEYGDMIREAFSHGLRMKYGTNEESNGNVEEEVEDSQFKILSSSQSTVTKLRHISLSQERGCSALGDVLVISYNAPAFSSSLSSTDIEELRKTHMTEIVENANARLENVHIDILSFCLLENDSRLHAERSCTQRAYHYLLPLSWLPGGDDLAMWWRENQEQDGANQSQPPPKKNSPRRHRRSFGGVNGGEFRAKKPPPNLSLRLLKDALRKAESRDLSQDEIDDIRKAGDSNNRRKISGGRFGALGLKERRCWHNYAAAKLQGLASPSNEPPWKSLDRVRIVEFFSHRPATDLGNEDVILVIEFRGEDFLEESVRRIVGAAVAMTHGWLPNDYYDVSTQPDILLETPLAPEGRLYFAGARFHFDELARGESLFEESLSGSSEEDHAIAWANEMRCRILDRRSLLKDEEKRWIHDVESTVCPRICTQIATMKSVTEELSLPLRTSNAPPEYGNVLGILRDIVSSGRWPETSEARSKVIRQIAEASNGKDASGQESGGGSFTVVSPQFQGGILMDGSTHFVPPKANALFPDLAEAVFELENKIHPNRPPSSHCAVNCRAQFLPHVDSGRGAGQSLSMIVGLGDYNAGEIFVESVPTDIRYEPLEFDGWKQRHWTARYKGERFSLVWFTPDMGATTATST